MRKIKGGRGRERRWRTMRMGEWMGEWKYWVGFRLGIDKTGEGRLERATMCLSIQPTHTIA
jgi:hypothetical protein